jgi:hypothetical protein
MTDTNNGWPDKPGVPMNSEKDGWHWLRSSNGELIAAKYFAANENGWPEWPTWIGGQSPEIARTARFHAYIGPCLTPDQATALQSRIAELEEALATTRREGIEESAQSLIEKYQSMVIRPNTPEAWRFSILQDLRAMAGEKPNVITAADIDAVQEGGK